MLATVRDRAISAFKKANPGTPANLQVAKSRTRKEIQVTSNIDGELKVLRWSYADGGKLRRI